MSREDVELVRAGYDALNRGDHEAWISNLHPEIELHTLASSPDAAVYRGHEGARKWIKSVWEVGGGEGTRFEPEQITETGHLVVVSVRALLFVRGGSVPVQARIFHVIEVSEGKARRIWGYGTEAEALEAVRLRD